MAFNKVIAEGYVGKDAELKMFDATEGVLKFSVGVTEKWTDKKSNEKKERCEWFNCEMFGKRASSLAKYVTKGSRILVEGSLRTDSYEKDGEKKFFTKVIVRDVQLLGNKGDAKPAESSHGADDESDIPF